MGRLWSDLGPIKKETISLFFVQKRTCTYCKRVKAGQGKGKEHWRRAVMSWQWSMQGAPYYHLLWNMSWWEKLFAKIIAFWFIPKNVDNFTKKKHFYVNFTSPKGLYRHSQICKKGLYRHSQICRFFEHGFDPPLPLFGVSLTAVEGYRMLWQLLPAVVSSESFYELWQLLSDVSSRGFNKLWNLCQTSSWFGLPTGRQGKTMIGPGTNKKI